MSEVKIAPFGSWCSPITSELIVAGSISLQDVLLDREDIYWLEVRPHEAGRSVLVRLLPDGSTRDVNPSPTNARTRVHEYGGGSVCVSGGVAYFANFLDQRLYRQSEEGVPAPLTPASGESGPPAALRYADGILDRRRNRWIGVREDHRDPGREAVNTLVAVDAAEGGEGVVLTEGYDFYSSARLSPDGERLAWLCWNHPNMPWVGTELWVAEVTADGGLSSARLVAGGLEESIFQPEWSPDGQLCFVSDRTGWWNLYRLAVSLPEAVAVPLCPLDAEFGRAQWVFGISTYAFAGPERIVCVYSQRGRDRLAILTLADGKLEPLDLPYTEYGAVRASGNRVAFRCGSPLHPATVASLDLESGELRVHRTATGLAERPELSRCFTRAQFLEFPTEDGLTAFGIYYPPFHPDYAAPEGEKPPLVVMCHGGPTSSAASSLSLHKQYWTSRGIAVLDVNYGGSTGFGRAYRGRLDGRWGIVDVDDCVNGAKFLAAQGLADSKRCVCTGGSAGGYTTLAVLAFRDFFRGGASHFGVSDLGALVRDTHKFESRYLDGLIGPYPEAEEVYRQRSPLYHADQIHAPVAFFQGDEDRVVPPSQTEEMVEALRRNGVPTSYLLFQGEQHGFRKSQNIQRSLDAELYFYAALVFHVDLTF